MDNLFSTFSSWRLAQILSLLLKSEVPLSVQKIAVQLGCSRWVISKFIKQLCDKGFLVEIQPNKGYMLIAEPIDLLSVRVEARLSEDSLGVPFIHLFEIDSTNLEASRRVKDGQLAHGACLAADFQNAGRGRFNRQWQALPASSLLFSLLLRPTTLAFSEKFFLTNIVAIALCRAIEQMSALKPKIKWPNDIYIDGYKLAGILTEANCRAKQLDYVIVGVGLNVNLSITQLPKLISEQATSLRIASGKIWDRSLIMSAILQQINRLYHKLLGGDHQGLMSEYNAYCYLLDRWVQIRDGKQVRKGIVRGVNINGTLLLEEEGDIISIYHGDVSVISVK